MAHEHLNHGGKTLSLEINAYPIKDENGEVSRIIHLARDETERRRAEEEIRRSSEKIRMFAYSIAHDLKGPAIGIHGVTNLLQKHYGHALDERGRKYCDTILKAAEQISAFVYQINEYISAKEVSLTIEKVSMKEVLKTVEEEFSQRLQDRQITWRAPDSVPEVKADRLSVLRVVRNLVDNALKYGGQKLSHIEIGYEESDDSHIFSVKDDGIGLRADQQEGLFAAFVRKGTSRGVAGAGIGLAIVREIAERHKGKVWLLSHHGEGTIFYVSFSKNLELPFSSFVTPSKENVEGFSDPEIVKTTTQEGKRYGPIGLETVGYQ
jgi:light-regulated signal transduction histidine kinase (bacteriophytochrome)